MIHGIGASDGISIGKVFKYHQVELIVNKNTIQDIEAELRLLDTSIQKSIHDLKVLQEKTQENMDSETAEIFEAHIEILNDPELMSAIKSKIQEEYINADYALKTVSDTFVEMFEMMDNEYIRERAADIKDVTKRLLMHIQGIESTVLSEICDEIILVAKDLTPSDTAQLNRNLVKGFITDIGGRTSHSAIMARTLEIPAVVGTNNGFDVLKDNDYIILNGFTGEVVINPTDEEVHLYEAKIADYNEQKAIWEVFKELPSMTKDKKHIEIGANIGEPDDVESVLSHGGECIGLYRTEFLYMGKKDFPNEEVQYNAYKDVLNRMGQKPVVVRTLDIGGDKELSYLKMEHEMNPFLGNRALRLCLTMPEIFKIQLRALLRASVHGNLHIMFPMIATIDEFRSGKKLLQEVEKEMIAEGIAFSDTYKLGIMIEIPAAAILADVFAKEVDFFSIGTNDLIQYSFAADRMNEHVSYLYQPFNPSLLRLISMVIKAAHKEGKWVGMCGEVAGEPKALPLLIGLGLDEFSMSASAILRTRYMASKMDSQEAKILADKALEAENQEAVEVLVNEFLKSIEE